MSPRFTHETTFEDRADAGRRLAVELQAMPLVDPVVLALPRGGVPVAAEVAAALGAPLDLVLVRKVGVPGFEELAVAAVVDGGSPEIVINVGIARSEGVTDAEIEAGAKDELDEIERRRQRYLGSHPRQPLAGRDLIVVDDGIATGASVKAAIKALRRKGPRRIILAVPVAPSDALEEMRQIADEVVFLDAPAGFHSVGASYRDFHQLEDHEVIALLERAIASHGGRDSQTRG